MAWSFQCWFLGVAKSPPRFGWYHGRECGSSTERKLLGRGRDSLFWELAFRNVVNLTIQQCCFRNSAERLNCSFSMWLPRVGGIRYSANLPLITLSDRNLTMSILRIGQNSFVIYWISWFIALHLSRNWVFFLRKHDRKLSFVGLSGVLLYPSWKRSAYPNCLRIITKTKSNV